MDINPVRNIVEICRKTLRIFLVLALISLGVFNLYLLINEPKNTHNSMLELCERECSLEMPEEVLVSSGYHQDQCTCTVRIGRPLDGR